MSANIIDGAALARALRNKLGERARALLAGGRAPGLAVLLVGDDPASQVYVRNKVRACEEAGIHSVLERHPASVTEAHLAQRVAALNADASIDGILIQLPLPPGLNAQRLIEAIAPHKDVDGLQVHSAGALLTGSAGFRPCTPLGVMHMLDQIGASLRGAHAVVMGRSTTVGKPMALLLLQRDATVTLCHSATRDLGEHTRRADIVVAAVGRRAMLTADMVKPGAVVIDVGINRGADGKLCGDVDFAGVAQVASWITPVPGGVGPMTIAMLLSNTVVSAERTLGA
jgi:methylenetetrahydrofolate dehydrogenase (NADP+)/methenyltetrahydrofolate cyclohydrolase